MVEQLFYILDISVNGDCALWWKPNARGYTSNLLEAGKYNAEFAFNRRTTDVPIPCDVAEGAVMHHVGRDAPALANFIQTGRQRVAEEKRHFQQLARARGGH